jgi:hypothetical protein
MDGALVAVVGSLGAPQERPPDRSHAMNVSVGYESIGDGSYMEDPSWI